MLAMLILSLFYCDAQNVSFGYNDDGSQLDSAESFWGKLLNKVSDV